MLNYKINKIINILSIIHISLFSQPMNSYLTKCISEELNSLYPWSHLITTHKTLTGNLTSCVLRHSNKQGGLAAHHSVLRNFQCHNTVCESNACHLDNLLYTRLIISMTELYSSLVGCPPIEVVISGSLMLRYKSRSQDPCKLKLVDDSALHESRTENGGRQR